MGDHDKFCVWAKIGHPGTPCLADPARVRADERGWIARANADSIEAEVRKRLRAQVEALPLQVVNMQAVPGKPDDFQEAVLLDDVLALLGGESDG